MVLTTLLATINIIQLKYVPVETWHEIQKELWPIRKRFVQSFIQKARIPQIDLDHSEIEISIVRFQQPLSPFPIKTSMDVCRLTRTISYYCQPTTTTVTRIDCNRRVVNSVGDKGLRTISLTLRSKTSLYRSSRGGG